MTLYGTAQMPGSCGELVQGTLAGINFHVTCPINLYSEVKIMLTTSLKKFDYPKGRVKTARAVRMLLNHLGYPQMGGKIEIFSNIPLGKGMASSTADITAACYAAAAALEIEVSATLIKKIALSLEPTDGIFLPGIHLFDHVQGKVFEYLGEPLQVGILIFDFGGTVDTMQFNKRPELPYLNYLKELQVKRALECIKQGLQERKPAELGKGATLSSLANQDILPKLQLEKLIAFAESSGAYGVNIAHSGTVAGLLLPAGQEKDLLLQQEAQQKFPELIKLYKVRMISGGPRIDIDLGEGEERHDLPARG